MTRLSTDNELFFTSNNHPPLAIHSRFIFNTELALLRLNDAMDYFRACTILAVHLFLISFLVLSSFRKPTRLRKRDKTGESWNAPSAREEYVAEAQRELSLSLVQRQISTDHVYSRHSTDVHCTCRVSIQWPRVLANSIIML